MSDLRDQGYQVCRSVLSSDDIATLRGAITETIDRAAAALRAPFTMSHPEVPLERRMDVIAKQDAACALSLFREAMADSHRDERISALSRHTSVTSIVRDLLQGYTWTGQAIRPRAVVSTFSEASFQWHQDVVRETRRYNSCGTVRLACWIPLADVDAKTGALESMPGRWNRPMPHVKSHDGQFVVEDHLLPDAPREIALLTSGDMLVLDRFIPHRSHPLQDGHSRWALAMWVKAMPAEETGMVAR